METWRLELNQVLDVALLKQLEEKEQTSESDDEAAAFGIFDQYDEAAQNEKDLEAVAATLAAWHGKDGSLSELSAEHVPKKYRLLHCFYVKEVVGLPVPLVQGCSTSGHGDVIWAAAQFCAEALVEGLLGQLPGRGVLELGAGVGLPSCVALRLGARVVASDIQDHERVLALATSLALNLRVLPHEGQACVIPHFWGGNCEELTRGGQFDLVLCNDCLYVPDLHYALLETICSSLSLDGVALICFSLHMTAPKPQIFGFFDLARSFGLQVDAFGERQLPPRCANMPLERSYVYAYAMRRVQIAD